MKTEQLRDDFEITPESIREWAKNAYIGKEFYPTAFHVMAALEKGSDDDFYRNAEVYYNAYKNPPNVLQLAFAYINATSPEKEQL